MTSWLRDTVLLGKIQNDNNFLQMVSMAEDSLKSRSVNMVIDVMLKLSNICSLTRCCYKWINDQWANIRWFMKSVLVLFSSLSLILSDLIVRSLSWSRMCVKSQFEIFVLNRALGVQPIQKYGNYNFVHIPALLCCIFNSINTTVTCIPRSGPD